MADKVTTATQMRETIRMLMQPYANWDEYLTSAPRSVAIMGELVFISSVKDFSINKYAPKDGFKYIRFPESFRACLMQICNSGWHAFNEAHKKMDQMGIYTGKVPGYMKAAIYILFSATDEVIENLLPNQLQNICEIADDCVALADNVEKKYSDVINLIQELLEACVNTQHFYGEELENVKIDFDTTIKMLVKGLDAMGRVKEQWEKMVRFFQMVSNIIRTSLSKTLHNCKKLTYNRKLFNKDLLYNQAFEASNIASLVHMISTTYTEVSNKYLMDRVSSLGKLMAMDKDKPEFLSERLNLQESCRDAQEGILRLVLKNKDKFERQTDGRMAKIEGELKTVQAEMRETIRMITQSSANWEEYLTPAPRYVAIMGELVFISSVKDFSINKNAPKDGFKYIKDSDSFSACLMQIYNSGWYAFDEAHKKMDQMGIYTGKVPGYMKAAIYILFSATDEVIENLLPNQLQNICEIADDCVALADNVEKKYSDVINLIQELLEACVNAQHFYGEELENVKIDFDTTIKMLVKGLDAMGRVKEQWEKMVRFFQMVSNIIRTSLSKTLHNCKKLTYNRKLFTKDLLYNQAFEASNIASLVHMISTTYTEVSNKYLMDRVSSLGKLMAMDKERPEFFSEHLNLQESCWKALEGILRLVLKNKDEFERQTDGRVAKIEGELKAVLPAAPPEETERIREIVQAGFSEEELEDYC